MQFARFKRKRGAEELSVAVSEQDFPVVRDLVKLFERPWSKDTWMQNLVNVDEPTLKLLESACKGGTMDEKALKVLSHIPAFSTVADAIRNAIPVPTGFLFISLSSLLKNSTPLQPQALLANQVSYKRAWGCRGALFLSVFGRFSANHHSMDR